MRRPLEVDAMTTDELIEAANAVVREMTKSKSLDEDLVQEAIVGFLEGGIDKARKRVRSYYIANRQKPCAFTDISSSSDTVNGVPISRWID
jgi:hypothetical protein